MNIFRLEETPNFYNARVFGMSQMASMEETVYEVEQIDDDRIIKGKKQYFIKWRNFPVSDNTELLRTFLHEPNTLFFQVSVKFHLIFIFLNVFLPFGNQKRTSTVQI